MWVLWCLVVWSCFLFAVWVLFLFVCFTNCLTPAFFTQKLWSFSCLSGRALDLRVDLCLVALSIFTSLNLGLPVSQRSAAACEEKKTVRTVPDQKGLLGGKTSPTDMTTDRDGCGLSQWAFDCPRDACLFLVKEVSSPA